MKKAYYEGNYPDKFTASGKAKIDAEKIVGNLGFHNIGLCRRAYPIGWRSYMHVAMTALKLIFTMPRHGICFLQYPYGLVKHMIRIAKFKKTKTILLLHDLNSLRDWNDKDERKTLDGADVLIVHTDKMREWLVHNHIGKNHVVLEIFDYLEGGKIRETASAREGDYKLVFAGNLGKSKFIDKVAFENIELNLYGVGAEQRTFNKGVTYKGCFPPEQLAESMEGDFGLVWDGDSVQTCSGQLGDYLQLIAPHKLSMYLSAGLPVIVWSKSAMASFVEKNQLGLAVESLSDLETALRQVSTPQYTTMKRNVSDVSAKLGKGHYLEEAIRVSTELLTVPAASR